MWPQVMDMKFLNKGALVMFKMITLITIGLSSALTTHAADWDWTKTQPKAIPNQIEQLHGVFKGKGAKSNKTAYAIVYGIEEQGQPSGRFNIFLLSQDRKMGQVFEAEVIGLNRIGLISLGVSSTGEFLDPVLPPSGTIEIQLDSKGRKTLYLRSIESSKITEDFLFDRVSDDITLGPVLPRGSFANKTSSLNATTNTYQSSALYGTVSSLKLNGTFYTNFELAGLMVMRPENLDNNMRVHGESKIAGVLVSILDGRKESIIVAPAPAGGAPVAVEILKAK